MSATVDPRLAHLPDDLRAVAEEFLTLHEAWDTSWRATVQHGSMDIEWNHSGAYGRLECGPTQWLASWGFWNSETMTCQLGTIGSGVRSEGFAEFVRRFKL